MSQENQITLRGYVTAEPRLWQTAPTQTPVAEIRIGSTPRRLNRATGEWQDAETTYYSVKCWRRLAVNVVSSLRKGDMVIVRGKFTARQWVDEQQRSRVQIQVEADAVGHDLSYGWSHFIRGIQAPQSRAGLAGDGQEVTVAHGDWSVESDQNDQSDSEELTAADAGHDALAECLGEPVEAASMS